MSEEPMDPLPASFSSLLEREARSYATDPDAKSRVLRGVSRAVLFSLPVAVEATRVPPVNPGAVGAAPKSAAAAAGFTGAKVAALVALAFAAGGITGATVVARSNPLPSTTRVTSESPTAPSTPAASSAPGLWTTVTPAERPVASAATAPTPRAAPSTGRAVESGSLAREREVLDAARAALSHGEYVAALAAVHEHETKWPHGALEEEREALWIQTLAASGEREKAEQRAARFRRMFPGSMLEEVVRAAVTPDGG